MSQPDHNARSTSSHGFEEVSKRQTPARHFAQQNLQRPAQVRWMQEKSSC